MESGRGGARLGAGGKKPKLPPGKKRVRVSFTLPPEMVAWIRKQDTAGSKLVEKALNMLRGKVSL